jgi:hypothetical protein
LIRFPWLLLVQRRIRLFLTYTIGLLLSQAHSEQEYPSISPLLAMSLTLAQCLSVIDTGMTYDSAFLEKERIDVIGFWTVAIGSMSSSTIVAWLNNNATAHSILFDAIAIALTTLSQLLCPSSSLFSSSSSAPSLRNDTQILSHDQAMKCIQSYFASFDAIANIAFNVDHSRISESQNLRKSCEHVLQLLHRRCYEAQRNELQSSMIACNNPSALSASWSLQDHPLFVWCNAIRGSHLSSPESIHHNPFVLHRLRDFAIHEDPKRDYDDITHDGNKSYRRRRRRCIFAATALVALLNNALLTSSTATRAMDHLPIHVNQSIQTLIPILVKIFLNTEVNEVAQIMLQGLNQACQKESQILSIILTPSPELLVAPSMSASTRQDYLHRIVARLINVICIPLESTWNFTMQATLNIRKQALEVLFGIVKYNNNNNNNNDANIALNLGESRSLNDNDSTISTRIFWASIFTQILQLENDTVSIATTARFLRSCNSDWLCQVFDANTTLIQCCGRLLRNETTDPSSKLDILWIIWMLLQLGKGWDKDDASALSFTTHSVLARHAVVLDGLIKCALLSHRMNINSNIDNENQVPNNASTTFTQQYRLYEEIHAVAISIIAVLSLDVMNHRVLATHAGLLAALIRHVRRENPLRHGHEQDHAFPIVSDVFLKEQINCLILAM